MFSFKGRIPFVQVLARQGVVLNTQTFVSNCLKRPNVFETIDFQALKLILVQHRGLAKGIDLGFYLYLKSNCKCNLVS